MTVAGGLRSYYAAVAMIPELEKLFAFVLLYRKKGKRKREEAEAVARAREAAIEDERSSGSAADGADAGGSVSDEGGKKDGAGNGNEQAGEEVDDMLTPAQRRFRNKQLEREVRYSTCRIASWKYVRDERHVDGRRPVY